MARVTSKIEQEKAYKAKQDAILNNYQDQVNKLNDNTLNAKNEAYQAQQMASKYAENGLKQMGLNNTGQSETTHQASINNYMNALTGINNTKAETQASLEQNYKDNLAKLEQDRANEIKAEEEKAKEYEKGVVQEFKDYYEHKSPKEQKAWYDELMDSDLSDEAKAQIKNHFQAINYTKASQEEIYNGTLDEQKLSNIGDVNTAINTGTYQGRELSDPEKDKMREFKNRMFNAKDSKELNDIRTEMEYYFADVGGVNDDLVEYENGALDYNNAKINDSGDNFEYHSGSRTKGDNCSLLIDGKKYRVETGQAVLYGSELDQILESYGKKAGTLAVHDGVLYARDNECWYVVECRNKQHWDTLKKKYHLQDYSDYDLGENGFNNDSSTEYNPYQRERK